MSCDGLVPSGSTERLSVVHRAPFFRKLAADDGSNAAALSLFAPAAGLQLDCVPNPSARGAEPRRSNCPLSDLDRSSHKPAAEVEPVDVTRRLCPGEESGQLLRDRKSPCTARSPVDLRCRRSRNVYRDGLDGHAEEVISGHEDPGSTPAMAVVDDGCACVIWAVNRAVQVGWSFWAMPWLVAGCMCIYLSWHGPARSRREP